VALVTSCVAPGAAVAASPVAAFTWQLAGVRADASGAVVETNYDFTNESRTSPVALNACTISATTAIKTYRWTFSDGSAPISSSACVATWIRPLSSTYRSVNVTLVATPYVGSAVSVTHTIRYRDRVIASLGDSAASGEGAVQDGPTWAAHYCGRSGWAASAQSALSIQQSLPDTTVHFWHLACAGASITSNDSLWWFNRDHGGKPYDPTFYGGMLDPYNGSYNNVNPCCLPPQVDRLQQLQSQSGLPVDRLLLTVGANDTHWAEVAVPCLEVAIADLIATGGIGGGYATQNACVASYAPAVAISMKLLPGHFDALRNRIATELTPPVPPSRIYLTGYFDPLDSLSPQPPTCFGEALWEGGPSIAGPFLRSWAVQSVENPLQATVQAKAQQYGWHYVDGIRQAFQGHGVCHHPGTRWINSHLDSKTSQGDNNGTWHANRTGQKVIASILTPAIATGLATDPSGQEIAFEANTGNLWAVGSGPNSVSIGDLRLGMMNGTSPSITALVGGGYEMAFQANTGDLWVVGFGGGRASSPGDLHLGMLKGTSPSITALAQGGYQVAFQANTGHLWVIGAGPGATDLGDYGLGMMAGTSPSITGQTASGYKVAFQANTGHLWVVSADGGGDLNLGMLKGTSPSITALAQGGYQVAFQANTGHLWVIGAGPGATDPGDYDLGMMAGTSPSITAG
jgi:hypothetical protein